MRGGLSEAHPELPKPPAPAASAKKTHAIRRLEVMGKAWSPVWRHLRRSARAQIHYPRRQRAANFEREAPSARTRDGETISPQLRTRTRPVWGGTTTRGGGRFFVE